MHTFFLAVLLAACDSTAPSMDTAADSGPVSQSNDDDGNSDGNSGGNSGGNNDDGGEDDTPEPDLKNGYYLFVEHCAECHGEDGYSGEAPNLQGRVSRYDDTELMEIVLEGRGEMPGRELTEQEQVDLLAYLRMAFP